MMKNRNSTPMEESRKSVEIRLELISHATESILDMINRCTEEKDIDKQLKQAQAISLLTEALARFNFKIER